MKIDLSIESVREVLPTLEDDLAQLKIQRGKINHEIEALTVLVEALKRKIEVPDQIAQLKAEFHADFSPLTSPPESAE